MQTKRAHTVTYQQFTLRFLIIFAALIIVQFLTLLVVPQNPINFIWYVADLLIILLGYAKGRAFGLVSGLVGVFALGSVSIYQSFVLQSDSYTLSNAMWFVLFPIGGFFGGYLGEFVISIADKVEQDFKQNEDAMLIDTLTGLSTKRRFLMDIQYEIARCQRHFMGRARAQKVACEWSNCSATDLQDDEQFTVMLLQIRHHTELQALYGRKTLERIYLSIVENMESSSRFSDHKSRIGEGVFGFILPETPAERADVVRIRVLESTSSLEITPDKKSSRKISVQLYFSVVSAPFDGTTTEELYAVAERELQNANV